MSCMQCVYYQESYCAHDFKFYCGFYNCDFTRLVDDDQEACSHFCETIDGAFDRDVEDS